MFTQIYGTIVRTTNTSYSLFRNYNILPFVRSSFRIYDTNIKIQMGYHSEKILYCLREDNKKCSPKQCINHNLKTLNMLELATPLNKTSSFKKYGIIGIRPFISTNYYFLKKNKVVEVDEEIYDLIEWNQQDRIIAVLSYYNELSKKKRKSTKYTEEGKEILQNYYDAIMQRIINSKSNTVFGLIKGCTCCMEKTKTLLTS